MRSLTVADLAHIQQDATTWAVCWRLNKGAEILRQTAHDRDLEVDIGSPDVFDINGYYEKFLAFDATQIRGATDLAVDNMEADTLLESFGITAQHIRAGLFNDVRYTIFLVNWRSPAGSGLIVKRGVVGNIKTFARDLANFELRGLKQYLQQTIVETYSGSCRADLGDTRCGVNLASYTVSGDVDSIVTQRRVITTTATLGSPSVGAGYYTGGLLTWTTGGNTGLSMEVKTDDGAGELTLFEPLPYDIQIGDAFTLTPGCDKAIGTCRDRFENVVNFRGEPYIPGGNRLLAGNA